MTFKKNCQILNILHCELHFTFNVFIFNRNTTIFLLFNKGSLNLFFLFPYSNITFFYIQLPVLGCLVGRGAFC